MFHATSNPVTLQYEPLARRARAGVIRGLAQRLCRAASAPSRRRAPGPPRHSVGPA